MRTTAGPELVPGRIGEPAAVRYTNTGDHKGRPYGAVLSIAGAGFVPARIGEPTAVRRTNTGDHKGRPYEAVPRICRSILGVFGFLAGCGLPDTGEEPSSAMETDRIVSAVRGGLLEPVEHGEHFAIYDIGVKEYPPTTFLVQSSGQPINLGEDMLPHMNTADLWNYVRTNNVRLKDDSPSEVYLYNWIDGAQGPMVFDVGVVVSDDTVVDPGSGFEIKRYPAMTFASLIYEGPFPHEPDSGWQQLRWEERAKEKGLVYTERLYRELYHAFDHQTQQHITEVQIEIR